MGFYRAEQIAAQANEAMLYERLRALRLALAKVREHDVQPSHPCGPEQYGHVGRIADEALKADIEAAHRK